MVARKAARKRSDHVPGYSRHPIAYLVRSDGSLCTEMREPTYAECYDAELVIVVTSLGFEVTKDRHGHTGPVTEKEALVLVERTMGRRAKELRAQAQSVRDKTAQGMNEAEARLHAAFENMLRR